jgi:formamidopyrimidine-DNA glycosylase
MPELPEVETYRSYLAHNVLHKTIIGVEADFENYGRIFEASKLELASLEGESFEKALRYGKYCLLEATSERVLVLHFGMSGDVKYYKKGDPDPEHSAMVFSFQEGHKLAVISVRKRWRIKSALMDQTTISGIGNMYSDEILYHAGIKPDKKVNDFGKKDLETVYEKMISVLKTAIENGADSEKMPENYLIRRREAGAICGICGGKIENIKIAGRSAYFCSKHQK